MNRYNKLIAENKMLKEQNEKMSNSIIKCHEALLEYTVGNISPILLSNKISHSIKEEISRQAKENKYKPNN